jgi:hypothetical protein
MMAMVFCRGCGKQIHETAPTCPACGAPQAVAVTAAADEPETVAMGGKTASGLSLRPQEILLFEGNVTLFKSKVSASETQAVITNQRLIVAEGNRTVEKADLKSVVEEKYLTAIKVVFALREGGSLTFIAANRLRFTAAAKILSGKADISTMPRQPKLSMVKNGTAWLAAFGPLIASVIVALLVFALSDANGRLRPVQSVQVGTARVVLIYLFLLIDHRNLQAQGYNVKQLGLADPVTFPLYLFSRAKVFKQGKGPAIVWSALVAFTVFGFLLRFFN